MFPHPGPLMVLGLMFFTCSACVVGVANEMAETQKVKQEALLDLMLEEVRCDLEKNWIYVRGKVRNKGSASVDFVKVGVGWRDSAGTVVDTDYTFVVSREALAPEAAKSFEIMTSRDRRASECTSYIMTD